MDFTNASPDVQDVNTLLQNLLEKFYPSWDGSTLYESGKQWVAFDEVGYNDTLYPQTLPSLFGFSDDGIILKSIPSNMKSSTVGTSEKINITSFTTLKMIYIEDNTEGLVSFNFSANLAYVGIEIKKDPNYGTVLEFFISNDKTYNTGTMISMKEITFGSTSSFSIKKIWLE